VTLDVNGVAHPSADATQSVGGISFTAHYNGSTTYKTATNGCRQHTPTQPDSSVGTDIQAGKGADDAAGAAAVSSAAIGSTVHGPATVTGTVAGGTPTGTVTFAVYPSLHCFPARRASDLVTLDVNGVAHPSADATQSVGGISFTAHYNGSTTYK